MSGQDQFRKPVWLDPKQLESGSPAVHETASAREFELQQVREVRGEEEDNTPPVRGRRRCGGWWRLFGLSLGTLLVAGVGMELYRLLQWSLSIHPAMAGAVGALLAIVLISGGVQIRRSLRGLRQLRQVERIRAQAETLLEHRGQGQANGLLNALQRHYRDTAEQQALNDTVRVLDSAYSDSEIVRYLSDHAFGEQDRRARRCVQRYAVESGVLVALSPWASFDMLLVGWRNLRMLREIAGIYGVAPGAAAQWLLLKRVLHNLAFAGLSEMATDVGTAALGGSLAASLSARAGQGLGAGLFTARTGMQALRLCRPLPLEQGEQSLINSVTKGIVERLGRSKTAE